MCLVYCLRSFRCRLGRGVSTKPDAEIDPCGFFALVRSSLGVLMFGHAVCRVGASASIGSGCFMPSKRGERSCEGRVHRIQQALDRAARREGQLILTERLPVAEEFLVRRWWRDQREGPFISRTFLLLFFFVVRVVLAVGATVTRSRRRKRSRKGPISRSVGS